MRRDASAGRTVDEIRDRLGKYRIGTGRGIEAAAGLVEGERLDAAGSAIWRRRGWIIVASESGVWVVRRPRVFGRAHHEHFDWADLTSVESALERIELTFGERALRCPVLPPGERIRLLEAARRHLAGAGSGVTSEALDAVAHRDLGRMVAYRFKPTIDGVPDWLEPDEHVERAAAATLDFSGLLVLTDRRVLLLGDVGLRFGRQQVWSVARRDVRGASLVDQGLALDLGDDEVTLTQIIPPALQFVLHADLTPAAREHPYNQETPP